MGFETSAWGLPCPTRCAGADLLSLVRAACPTWWAEERLQYICFAPRLGQGAKGWDRCEVSTVFSGLGVAAGNSWRENKFPEACS